MEGTEEEFPAGPADLVGHKFKTEFFGYRRSEVDRYVRMLAQQWDEHLAPLAEAHAALSAARDRAEGARPYESLGEDVSGILTAAREHASALETQAADVLAGAEAERERVLLSTESERVHLLQQAAAEREQILRAARAERQQLEAGNSELHQQLTRVLRDVAPLLERLPEEPVVPVEPVPVAGEAPLESSQVQNVEVPVQFHSDGTQEQPTPDESFLDGAFQRGGGSTRHRKRGRRQEER